jgi:hypothetical protein
LLTPYKSKWDCGQAGGGDPADLDGNIILCGRSDRDADRFFNGSIAHLALFDSAVTQFEVATLYSAYAAAGEVTPGSRLITEGQTLLSVTDVGTVVTSTIVLLSQSRMSGVTSSLPQYPVDFLSYFP